MNLKITKLILSGFVPLLLAAAVLPCTAESNAWDGTWKLNKSEVHIHSSCSMLVGDRVSYALERTFRHCVCKRQGYRDMEAAPPPITWRRVKRDECVDIESSFLVKCCTMRTAPGLDLREAAIHEEL
jgi:hypothetical protein